MLFHNRPLVAILDRVDKNVPANFIQRLVFNKFMYNKQDFYEEQLQIRLDG